MSTKKLAYHTLIGFIILGIVYFILYTWFDVPLLYLIYTPVINTVLTPVSELLSAVFSPECWVIVGLAAIAYSIIQTRRSDSLQHERLLRFGLTIIATSVLLFVLKVLFGRYRPDLLFTSDLYGFHPFSFTHNAESTPSGHATMAFCGFYSISRLLKKSWLTSLLLLCAVCVAIAKLLLADHYVSDILFGGYLGIVSVLWMEVILNHTLPHARIAHKRKK